MNDYIKQRRAKFAEQLKDPNVRLQVEAMLVSEDGAHPLPVIESLFNRCDYSGKTLIQMLHSGFYGPINRGKLPAFELMIEHNPNLRARMATAIQAALDGSNIIRGYTDQGLPTDPNGRWPGLHLYGEVFNDWGGGPGGHAGAKKWREQFMAEATGDDQSTLALQKALNALGALPQLIEDGDYGPATKHAVENFQAAAGIAVDGEAGSQTWLAIHARLFQP